MCKIILKFGEPLTVEEMEKHRESVENGAGVLLWHRGALKSFRSMVHADMYKRYEAAHVQSPFYLFHSRFPSAGTVNPNNIQPFMDQKIGFCHNGTISRESLMLTVLAKRAAFNYADSDSLLLFKIMQGAPVSSAVSYLRTFNQNFIFVSAKLKRIYVIGYFEGDFKEGHLKKIKNRWTGDRHFVTCDFNGKVLDSVVYKAAPISIATPSRQRFTMDNCGRVSVFDGDVLPGME